MAYSKGKSKDSSGNAEVCGWIQAFLTDKPLSSSRKVLEWQNWAIGRLLAGWDPEMVKDRIRSAWSEWVLGGNVDDKPMPEELRKALAEVYRMADEGSSPAECAVVYRSLAIQYPDRPWIFNYAIDLERMGGTWRADLT